MKRRAIWTIGILAAVTLLLIAGCAQDTEPRALTSWDGTSTITTTQRRRPCTRMSLITSSGVVMASSLSRPWPHRGTHGRLHLAFPSARGRHLAHGEPFTATDVKFTLKRMALPETGAGLREHNQYRQIKEVQIIDDHTVDIVTHDREPVLLNRLCHLGASILPKHFFDRYDTLDEGSEAFENDPMGTGPYRVVEWIRDDRLIMEAFDDHRRGKAPIDRLIHRAIPEDSTRVAELITGGVQMALDIPPLEWDRVNSEPGMSINRANSQRVMAVMLSTAHGPCCFNR